MCDLAEHMTSYTLAAPDVSRNAALVSTLNPVKNQLGINTPSFYGDLWAEGNLVAVGSQEGTGVALVDIANPANPVFKSYYNPTDGGKFKDVVIKGNVGYFAVDDVNKSNTTGGVHIVDLSDPVNPRRIGQLPVGTNGSYRQVHNIYVDGNYLYQAPNDRPRVKVFDISNPASPRYIREILTSATNGQNNQNLHDLTVRNGKLYTSNTDNGITDVYDVSDIASPTWNTTAKRITSFNVGLRNHSNDVANDGSFIVCCRETSNGDCQIWSLLQPNTPVKLATINAATVGVDAYTPHNPVVVGDKLYISWYQAGVQVFDVKDPAHPVPLGAYDTHAGGVNANVDYLGGYAGNWGVFPYLGADKVLLSDMENGLFVVNMTAAVPEPALLAPLLLTITAGLTRLRNKKAAGRADGC